MTNYVYQYQWFYKLKSAVMRIDFSFNREKSLHMYNLFFLKLSENILSYKKPKKTKQQQHKHKNTQKGHRKKASNVNFLFFIIFNGL